MGYHSYLITPDFIFTLQTTTLQSRGNYDNFKELEAVKLKQQLKAWEKQEKKLKELKSKGITKANAEKEQMKAKSREPGAFSSIGSMP